jgi:hypothetical protein
MYKKNTKKIAAYIIILAIGLIFGLGLTYINANYIDQTSSPVSNNVPPPILLNDLSGDSPFIKISKLGIGTGSTLPDQARFSQNSLVVGGSTTLGKGLGVTNDATVLAEVRDTSNLKAFNFGDPTNNSLWQTDLSSYPRGFWVKGYTRAPYVAIGSDSYDPNNTSPVYNLYVEPNKGAVDIGGRNYCTLTAQELKDKGCPFNYKYNFRVKGGNTYVYTPTYLSQVIPPATSLSSEIVAICKTMTAISFPYSRNLGSCY